MKENTLLIVDDEQFILNCLRRVFKDEPFGVIATNNEEEAFKALEGNPIKVVISDYRMPKISGTDFLCKVKEQYPNSVRILLTGYSDIKIAEEAINKGEVFRFVKKPWDDQALRTIVQESIKKFDLAAEDRKRLNQDFYKRYK